MKMAATIEERIRKLEDELAQLKADKQNTDLGLLTLEEARKLPINTPILVASSPNDDTWCTGHFGGISENGQFFIFEYGRTLFSNDGRPAKNKYLYAKRDYTAPSIINWIPNTGTRPTVKGGASLVARRRDGLIITNLDRWTLEGRVNDIVEYAIIE
jgi:hypothetical protein